MTKSATKKRQLTERRAAGKNNRPPGQDPHDDDPVPEDIDEFRQALAQRIYSFVGNHTGAWRRCRLPLCRRTRSCRGRGCMPMPAPLDDADRGRVTARAYYLLKRMAEERESDQADGTESARADAAGSARAAAERGPRKSVRARARP